MIETFSLQCIIKTLTIGDELKYNTEQEEKKNDLDDKISLTKCNIYLL